MTVSKYTQENMCMLERTNCWNRIASVLPGNDWRDWAISGTLFRPRPQGQSLYPHVKNIICASSPRSHGQGISTHQGDRKPSSDVRTSKPLSLRRFFESVQSAINTLAIWLGGVEHHTHTIFEDRAPLFYSRMQRIVFRFLCCCSCSQCFSLR